MRSSLGGSLTGGTWMALVLLAAFSVAKASSGRVSFSGAVVEPTCAVADHQLSASVVAQAADGQASARLVCNQTATDPGRPYSRVVVDLDAARVANDRLLAYFARNQADPVNAKLIMRTYE